MKKDVMINFSGFNRYDNNENDKVEFITRGNLFSKGGKYYLKYKEINDEESVETTIKIEKDKVTIMRFGEYNTQLVIEQGRKHLNYYETPKGSMTVGIYSDEVMIDIDEKKGNILLNYDVELNNIMASRNTIKLGYEEV